MHISITLIIIIITCIVSIRCFGDKETFYKLAYSPYEIKHNKSNYKFLTHALVHADFIHLFFNMFVLYNFGENVEIYFNYFFGNLKGSFYFLLLYIGGIFFSNIISYKRHHENPNYTAVGASGAVSAIVFSFILISPFQMLYLFMSIPIPAVLFALLYLLYEHYMDKRGNTGIAHDAHFAGAIFGFLFTFMLQPSLLTDLVNGLIHFLQ